jgi:hypothetical protein
LTSDRVTLDDLERARAEHERWTEAFANDGSNNPNKYRSRIEDAAQRIDELTAKLKTQGDLPMSAHELARVELDHRFPLARHGDIVEHAGVRYRRHFWPKRKSRSGTSVTVWGKGWDEVK